MKLCELPGCEKPARQKWCSQRHGEMGFQLKNPGYRTADSSARSRQKREAAGKAVRAQQDAAETKETKMRAGEPGGLLQHVSGPLSAEEVEKRVSVRGKLAHHAGHKFNAELFCPHEDCGVWWWDHRADPQPCESGEAVPPASVYKRKPRRKASSDAAGSILSDERGGGGHG